jgi:hypothetical protein
MALHVYIIQRSDNAANTSPVFFIFTECQKRFTRPPSGDYGKKITAAEYTATELCYKLKVVQTKTLRMGIMSVLNDLLKSMNLTVRKGRYRPGIARNANFRFIPFV